MRTLGALYDRLIAGLAALSALAIGAMALWVTYEVVLRYVVRRPTIWANDLAEYTLIAATFLAAPWVLRKNAHVNIDLIVRALKPRSRRVLDIVLAFVGAAICLVLAWATATSVIEYYTRNMVMARIWSMPQYIPYVAIPIGSALLVIEFILQAVRAIRHQPPGTPAGDSSDLKL